ncbi:MAG: translation initiation factor IF-2 [Bacilli bacterium]|nr:translation initiation factor IF-2 [Bacilli bacterium]
MKVKEILEILKVPQEELIGKLSNVGIEADLETDIPSDIIKKLSKLYKVDIKPVKIKKESTPKAPVKEEKVLETKKEEEKAPLIEDEKESEIEEEVKEKVVTTSPKKIEAKPTVKKEEKPKPKKVEEVDVELTRVYDDTYNDYVKENKEYTRLKNVKKKQKNRQGRQRNVNDDKKERANVLYFIPGMNVAQIADGLGISYGEIVRKLIDLGFMVSATQTLERDVIELLAEDSGFTLKDKISEDVTRFEEIVIEDDEKNLVARPAIVTIMGHVDHGKTTLLDTIRNTKVVASEAGGITQHIGAYQVKKKGKTITFIDTPGHAAFTEMRARGAQATDIVVLVVAADDGVMPQTKEAIEHAQAAKVPIIVAINKMDKASANPDRVKQELTSYNLIPEEWGGSTIFVPISALTGMGVDDLLEMIVLTADIENYRANPNRLGVGLVIEAKLDKGRGPVATLLVKNGTIKIGDPIVVGNTYGKIRAMQDETKASIKSAGPSKAVEVTGLEEVPQAGDSFMVFEDEKTTRLISEQRTNRAFDLEKGVGKEINLAGLFDQLDDSQKELNLIIKGDVQGSIEALKGSLEKVEVEGAKIIVVRAGVGAITETDIALAVASRAIIIGFNIRPNATILKLAKEKKIEIRLYNIIYKVLEDIQAAMVGMLDPVFEEKITGEAEVRTIFKASKVGTIAGCYITNGYITRNSDIRLIRDSIVIYEGKLSSLKRFKDDVKEVKYGYECGMTIENYNDIKEGDVIEAYVMEKVK